MDLTAGLSTQLEGFLTEFLSATWVADIKPSAVSWVFPNKLDNGQGIEYIDQQAASGTFPTLISLSPALVYACLLGVLRMFLHHLVLKPVALWAFNIKELQEVTGEPAVETELALVKCNYRPANKDVRTFCAKYNNNNGGNGKASTGSSSSGSGNNSSSGSTAGVEIDLGSESAVNLYIWKKRRRGAQERKVVKFVEAVWRGLFYLVFEIVGYYTLVKPELAPWLQDTTQHWEHWPLHELTGAIKFYYQVELGAYIHQLMWTEVSRSDALEMMIHHITAILLISLSYITNFTRVGTSILFLHDAADIFLESAKIFNYTSKAPNRAWAKNCTDVVFATFAVIFFITRLIIYPRYIVSSVLLEAPLFLGGTDWVGYWVFAGLLCVLQFLHVFWFYLIGRMVWRLVTTGIEKDERSDDESEDEPPSSDSPRATARATRSNTKKNR